MLLAFCYPISKFHINAPVHIVWRKSNIIVGQREGSKSRSRTQGETLCILLVPVMGDFGSSASSTSGMPSREKEGCQRRIFSSGISRGGLRLARKACRRKEIANHFEGRSDTWLCLLGDKSTVSLTLWCLRTICSKFRLKTFLLLMRVEAPKHPPPFDPRPSFDPAPPTDSPLPSSSVLLSIVSWNCSYFFRS